MTKLGFFIVLIGVYGFLIGRSFPIIKQNTPKAKEPENKGFMVRPGPTTDSQFEWQDLNGKVIAEWKSDGTVWRGKVCLGKAESLQQVYALLGMKWEP